jgi:hypothetical protein
MGHHILPQLHHPELRGDNTLHVVGVVSNVERYHARYRLAREWIERMRATRGVTLHMVEAAFGDRQHELVDADEHGLRLRVTTNAWIKENMINLGVRHLLPQDWRYVAWVDCDVEFRDPYWAQETLHQLQHFPLLQPWQSCADLGPHGSVFLTHTSFGCVDQRGVRKQTHPGEPYQYAHSGFAWACTRAFWEQVGGLLDVAILGSGDHHMAWAAIGDAARSVHKGMSDGFKRACLAWQTRATKLTHREVGFVPGRIEHHFHGPKKRRYYRERWQILVANGYDPETDLMRDAQGVVHIVGKPALEKSIRQYNRARLEDSIEET